MLEQSNFEKHMVIILSSLKKLMSDQRVELFLRTNTSTQSMQKIIIYLNGAFACSVTLMIIFTRYVWISDCTRTMKVLREP